MSEAVNSSKPEELSNYEALKSRLASVPAQPGVYVYKDKDGRVIYVGKAKNLRNRMRSYFVPEDRLLPKVRLMVSRMAEFDYIVTSSEVEALILENNLIKEYHPRYNILMRDDKSFPYLKLSITEDFPRIAVVRERKDGKSKYFGPYVDAGGLKEAAAALRDVFPLRSCRTLHQNRRPCLNYYINKCSSPCTGRISAEDYRQMVDSLLTFLEGDYQSLIDSKQREMAEAAAAYEYEKAARLRDQVEGLRSLATRQFIVFEQRYNLDAVALVSGDKESLAFALRIREGKVVAQESFWLKKAMDEDEAAIMEFFLRQYCASQDEQPQEILVNLVPEGKSLLESWLKEQAGHSIRIHRPSRGDRKKVLELAERSARAVWEERTRENLESRKALSAVAEALNLEALPERIECFDVSHLAGRDTVASMVVFTNARADNKAYRRFKITQEQNDDFASLQEAIRRRFTEGMKGNPAFLPLPDLLLIDGGYGQINLVARQLEEMGVEVAAAGIAKKQEALFRAGQPVPLVLDRRNEGLKLLQRLRDEAHRCAIEYNRLRRTKRGLSSELDSISGIGPKRKQQLITQFGSVKKMKTASLEELQATPGMNRTSAQKLFDFFHPAE